MSAVRQRKTVNTGAKENKSDESNGSSSKSKQKDNEKKG